MGLKHNEQPHISTRATDQNLAEAEQSADSWHGEKKRTDDIDQQAAQKPAESFKRDWRFWTIISTLSVIGILSSLENTVVVTSLPIILDELAIGENYIWITNVFFLTG